MTMDSSIAHASIKAMGRARLALAFAAALTLHAPATAQLQLVWADEFDGTNLDTSKWEYQVGNGCPNLCGWGNSELEYYRPQNVTVSGGTLRITAKQESFAGMPYTSGRIRTRGLGDWTYGRFEVRARLPKGQGLWPAIWMLPTNDAYGGWAASGEIDIMELIGHEPNKVHGTIHYGAPWPGNDYSGTSYTLPSGDFSNAFHTFAVEWTPTEIRWFVDGLQYSSRTWWWSSGGAYPAPFDQPFHLLLNVAVGGVWPGNPDASTQFPQVMEVDYVRVYQDGGQGPCSLEFDSMEHGDPQNNAWFAFGGPNGGGAIYGVSGDVPPSEGGAKALGVSFGSSGAAGYQGGFGRTKLLDLKDATHFEFWIRPDAGVAGTLEINLQDDDNGDNSIPAQPDGSDDEFQALLTVGGPGAAITAGAGWQHVVVPLADFVDDNSYLWGGNGVLDAVPTSNGGNGQLVNVVIALVSATGGDTVFKTDAWRFTRRTASVSGVVWSDLDGDGQRLGEPGLQGVQLELYDPLRGTALSTATTDASGAYTLTGATEGTVEVRVVLGSLPAGSTATHDPDGIATEGLATATLSCDEALTGQDFGFQVPTSLGTRYCSPAVPNSTGLPAHIDLVGSPSLAQGNLTLEATQLPTNQFGLFITSRNTGSNPFSAGVLCLSAPIGRFAGPSQLQNSGSAGAFSLAIDLTQNWPVAGVSAPSVGETWHFSAWFRDGAAGSNFTDAVSLTFE